MMNLLMKRRYFSAFVVMLIMSWSTGCNTVSLNLWDKNRIYTANDEHPVMEVVGIWQTADGQDTNNLPCRGFGGQILFFASGYKTPVLIEGDVSIYLFDDVGTTEEQSKPYHVYNFTAEQWKYFYRDSTLGPCYQVFVPYTRPGGLESDCSLRIKYTPKNGIPIYSKVATIHIRGLKKAKTQELAAKDKSSEVNNAVSKSDVEQKADIKQASGEKSSFKSDLLQDLISTGPAPGAQVQEQRVQKLEAFLKKMDPDPREFQPNYTITHSRRVNGLSLSDDLDKQHQVQSEEKNTESLQDQERNEGESKVKELLGIEE